MKIGTACHSCPVGQCHARPRDEAVRSNAPRTKPQICLRCSRNDLRIVQERGICVSCANRQYEVARGRNAKGKAPTKASPLNEFAIATEAPDGEVTFRCVDAQHLAEAVGVVAHTRLHRLPAGTRLTEARPGPSVWSTTERRFVVGCPACGHAGLLERKTHGTMAYHCPNCEGHPQGLGWALAGARAATMLLDVGGLAAWLEASTADLLPNQWNFTGFGCRHCRGAMLQARRGADDSVDVRCPACGEASK